MFEGNLKYTDWTDFENRLNTAKEKGFNSLEELLSIMDMDMTIYKKIKNNMIYNWIDSISKSLIHSISHLENLPKKGDYIFKNKKEQSRILLVCSSGQENRNIFGQTNSTQGINMIPRFDISKIDDYYTLKKEDSIEILNKIIQYVWIYKFYNQYLLKKEARVPKYLYRGIRFNNISCDIKYPENIDYLERNKIRCDYIINKIKTNGLKSISEGNFLSFTSKKTVAEYFSNSEGCIVRINTKDVDIVSSELTEDLFKEPNSFNGKREHEYIIDIRRLKNIADIEIVESDYLFSINDFNAVKHFKHDDKQADYDIDWNNKKYHVNICKYWRNNTTLVYSVYVKSYDDNINIYYYKDCQKNLGFDPVPNEKTIPFISNFKLSKKSRY